MSLPSRDPVGSDAESRRVEEVVDRRQPTPVARNLEHEPVWARDFNNLAHEWRRLFAELFGTFLLVLAAAGAGVVDARTQAASAGQPQ